MNQPAAPYGDDTAAELLRQVLDLALVVRDEGPDAVTAVLDSIADPRAALVVAAAVIRVDLPVDPWWQQEPGAGSQQVAEEVVTAQPLIPEGYQRQPVAVCGTPSGYAKHRRLHEASCQPCVVARRNDERARVQRRRARQAVAA